MPLPHVKRFMLTNANGGKDPALPLISFPSTILKEGFLLASLFSGKYEYLMDVPNKETEGWVEGFKSISIFLDHRSCPPPFHLHYLPPFQFMSSARSRGAGRDSSSPSLT